LAAQLVKLPASEQELLVTELVSRLGDLGHREGRKGISTAVRILGVLSRKQGDSALFRRCIGALFDVEPALNQWSLNDTLDLFVTLDEKQAALAAAELHGNTVALRWYQTLAERYYDLEKIRLPLRKLLR